MNEFLIVSSILLWAVVVFNLLLTLALVRRMNNTSPSGMPETLKVGQPAPDFKAESLHGETVTLASYAGRVVAFVFASPRCNPCLEEMPKLEALRPKAGLAGVELVIVNDASIADTQAMADEFHLTLPMLAASRSANDFMDSYKAAGTPFYCIVNAKGKVQATGFLDNTWKELATAWEAAAARPVGKKALASLAPADGN